MIKGPLMKLFLVIALFSASTFMGAQVRAQSKKTSATPSVPQLTRTTTRHDLRRFGYGGTLTIVGAPVGSITIEGWPRNEVEVRADIQLRADTEADLDRLAAVNGFAMDEDVNHISILTIGTHDKKYMRTAKKFPKALLGMPWKIDYRIRVPSLTDLEINSGRGPINVTGVEGAIRVSAAESETNMTLSGGTVTATIGLGRVNLSVPVRSWRGAGVEVRLASGQLNVELPVGFNGDVDAEVLRGGKIEDTFGGLASREKPGITPQLIKARAGAGGAFFKFTVGDGTITIKRSQ